MKRPLADFELWTEVVKSIKPLRRGKPHKAAAMVAPVSKTHSTPIVSAPHVHVPRATAGHPPPLSGFDRRTTQKLTRGNVDIDARLDLHGTGVELARVKLWNFLRECHAQGYRTALVITGKGDSPFARHTLHGSGHFHAPERLGRLRREVPDWLHEAEFRALVSGFQPAHPKHGGGGAFYVRLRRVRPDR